MTRMQQHYNDVVRPAMQERFGYENPMRIPKLDKIVLNMGMGDGVRDSKVVQSALVELTAIAGQQPVITKARKSISNFKLREGMDIGVKVTLRRQRMFEFMDRLINIALPRVRDFRGVSPKSFDGRGNFSLGLREQIVFPEIDYDKVDEIRGLDIAMVTTANTDEEARELLAGFGMPFMN
ncbi:MAG: 50S ribosomal protein L5 [Alphaproteobacteria bacterium]|nr:50S ribosomal protein L5 [Alphaproteobacteria bacterium]|tara:strand:- start:1370 stop:1909 length:540 start_codon:yes stop_codon:yes gene_type:complete